MENSLATHLYGLRISEPPDTPSTSDAIRQFLVKAGEIYRQSITSALVSIWIEELGQLSRRAVSRFVPPHITDVET